MRRFVLAVMIGVLCFGPPPAWAGTPDEPELTDHCGVGNGAGALDSDVSPSWMDICAGWFETLTGSEGPAALRVNVKFAGSVQERPIPMSYSLSFDVGDCRYSVTRTDDGADALGELVGTSVAVGCGDEPTSRMWAPDSVMVENGNVLETTLVFSDGLAGFADDFDEGSRLENLSARAAVSDDYSFGGMCLFEFCHYHGEDRASGGATYAVEAGDGPVVTGPVVSGWRPVECVDGPVAQGSATSPHAADASHDYDSRVLPVPGSRRAAFDVRSAWFSVTPEGDVALSILPQGPARTAGTVTYMVEFNDAHAVVEDRADGTWQAVVAANAGPDMGLPGSAVEEWAWQPASYDAQTGQVSFVIPDAYLPGPGGALDLSFVGSHYRPEGQAAIDSRYLSSTLVDAAEVYCAASA